MLERGQVVVIEAGGSLELGGVLGVGGKRIKLRLRSGKAARVPRERLLHSLERFLEPDASFFKRVESWRSKLPTLVDEETFDELWVGLDVSRTHSLEELARALTGTATDAALLTIFSLLNARSDEFRVLKGAISRHDDETLQRIRERRRLEAEALEQDSAFVIWFDALPKVIEGGAAPTPEHGLEGVLEGLCTFALEGSARASRRSRRLCTRLDLSDPDAALRALCERGLLDRDVNELPSRSGLPVGFATAILESARHLAERLTPWPSEPPRRSFVGHRTLTIDEPTTLDLDDAISIWSSAAGWSVAVHIADVASVIGHDGALDHAARGRGTSVYYRDIVAAMLPESLSEGALSLIAGRRRPTVSLLAEFDEGFELLGAPRFFAGLVEVTERLSYHESRGPAWHDDAELRALEGVANALQQRRRAAGASVLSRHELKVSVQQGRVEVSRVAADSPGHLAVSELMIFYNTWLAQRLSEAGFGAFFKIQGRRLDAQGRYPSAQTSIEPGPHRGLGVECYVQATAPIRRYSDLIAQRQLTALLRGEGRVYDEQQLRELKSAQESLQSRARRAEESRLRYWLYRYLEQNPGPHAATVTRVRGDGLGFQFEALQMGGRIEGRSSGPTVAMGDRIHVVARGVEPRRRAALFALAQDCGPQG